MYQALYRKWRPRSFDDVSGQEHITETLKRQIMSGRLSHAYLFTGTRGTGKTTCAKILAKAVNCEAPENGNPCNKCPSCKGIDSGGIMDVTEMDAASNNGVDNVRALREEAVYMPATVKKRVYIIDEVHMLSGQAFNALLKIMEEPPEHLLFILATTELHKVPATILSRCQKYAFKRISPTVISERLKYIAAEEGFELTEEASALLARLSDGSFRDAISLLDQCSGNTVIDRQHVLNCIGLAENDEILNIFTDLIKADGFSALERLSALYSGGKDVSSVLSQLAGLHRDIMLKKLAPKGSGGLLSGAFREEDLLRFSESIPISRLLSGLETLQSVLSELDRSADRKTAAEICLLRLIELPSEVRAPAQSSNLISEVSTQMSANKPAPEPMPERNAVKIPVEEATSDQVSPREPGAFSSQEHTYSALLKALTNKIDPSLYSILEDSTHADGNISGNAIIISAKSPFSLALIDTADVKEAIKSAAESIWSGSFAVKVQEASLNEADMKSKLEKLSRFDNIKFE